MRVDNFALDFGVELGQVRNELRRVLEVLAVPRRKVTRFLQELDWSRVR